MSADMNIREHSEVIDSEGQHVGTVDHMDGQRIKLTKKDPAAHGVHHYISLDHVESAGEQVKLRVPASEALQS